jgi:hypothetical protein
MNVKAVEARYNIKVKPSHILVRRLKGQVSKFEKRYEISTAQMLQQVNAGKMRETKEIDQWMQYHFVLRRFLNEKSSEKARQARLEHIRKLPTHI